MIEPTFVPSAVEAYAARGGPWDVDPLGTLLDVGHPSAIAVVDGSRRLTFDDMAVGAARLAEMLTAHGVGQGDAVTFQFPNRHESLLTYLACWRLGAIAVPIHGRAALGEVATAATTVASALHLHGRDHPACPAISNIDVDIASSVGRQDQSETPLRDTDPADVAVVLFTAGTSGKPKAVLHTHQSLGCKARSMVDVHGLTSDDVVLMPAPLAHVSGLLNGALVPWAAGMKTVLMAKWEPARALDLIEEEQVSFMVGPPTFFTGLVTDPSFTTDRVASLRLVSSGGAGVTEEFAREAADRLGCVVKRTYGSTEAPTVATTPVALHHDSHAVTTEGCATPTTRLRVVNPNSSNITAPRAEGELQVAGPELFAGYLDPTATAEAMDGDWFRTGDLARIGTDGWLTITGRLADIIIRGGENISPAEVSAVLESHPSVDQAVVVGVADEHLGERVAAFVVTTRPFELETCRSWFESQGVTRFKWPEIVVLLDAIPLLPSGKPDKAALRRR